MRNIFLLLVCILTIQSITAQDEAVFMQYHVNPVLINPAAAGFDEGIKDGRFLDLSTHNLFINARTQWTGFPDAPKTITVNYNGAVSKVFGVGFGLLSESAAQLTRLKLQMNFAFHHTFDKKIKAAAGFFTEFQQMTVDNDIMGTSFFQDSDRLLIDILEGKSVFDAGIGVRVATKWGTRMGITFNNLVRARLADIAGETSGGFFSFYTFNLGHTFELSDLNHVKLEPSIMIRQIRDVPFQMDFNLKAIFLDDRLIAGLSYRSLGALGILLGVNINPDRSESVKRYNLKLYYSYDLSFQHFQRFNTGSNEITLAFRFNKKSKKKK